MGNPKENPGKMSEELQALIMEIKKAGDEFEVPESTYKALLTFEVQGEDVISATKGVDSLYKDYITYVVAKLVESCKELSGYSEADYERELERELAEDAKNRYVKIFSTPTVKGYTPKKGSFTIHGAKIYQSGVAIPINGEMRYFSANSNPYGYHSLDSWIAEFFHQINLALTRDLVARTLSIAKSTFRRPNTSIAEFSHQYNLGLTRDIVARTPKDLYILASFFRRLLSQ